MPTEPSDERVEKLAAKLLRDGYPAAENMESARRVAQSMLEESDERMSDPAVDDLDDDGVERRSSGQTSSRPNQ
jgi:hypothetical protein